MPWGANALGRYHGRGRSPVSRHPGVVARRASVGRWPRAVTGQPNRAGDRPWERAAAHSLVPAMTPGRRRRPGVVARLDVDAIPGDAGQGGGPVMGHDGGHHAGLSVKRTGKALAVLSQLLDRAVEGKRLVRNPRDRGQAAQGPAAPRCASWTPARSRRSPRRSTRGTRPLIRFGAYIGPAAERADRAQGRPPGPAAWHRARRRGGDRGRRAAALGRRQDPRGPHRAAAPVDHRRAGRPPRRPAPRARGPGVPGAAGRADALVEVRPSGYFKPAALAAGLPETAAAVRPAPHAARRC